MNDLLSSLVFLPPQTGRLWSGPTKVSHAVCLRSQRKDDQAGKDDQAALPEVRIPLPLFWSNPPWHDLRADAADGLASEVADRGVSVSALLRDLSSEDHAVAFHQTANDRHRMIPYRSQRYGLLPQDFDHASLIDLRLTVPRDEQGRMAFSPEQIRRWEATSPEAPLAGGGWVPAASFPPDVPSLDELSLKIQQLHALAPAAAVLVSIFPHRLDEDLPAVLAQNPDGVLLRCTDPHFPPLMVAEIVKRASEWMKHHGCQHKPLWIDAGAMSPSDAVKLIHLGATAISIDAWCEPMIAHMTTTMKLSATHGQDPNARGTSPVRPVSQSAINEVVQYMLQPFIDEFLGLTESIASLPLNARFATTDAAWSASLGIPLLSPGQSL